MDTIKHVALFEDRHLFPDYVRDSVFPGKQKYHVKDRELFHATAMESLSKWKQEGVTSIYVYLSGLNSAVRALESAAWKLGLYLRTYEYSFSQNIWLPDTLEPFEERSPHPLTPREVEQWRKETELRNEFKGREESLHIAYVEIYNDIVLKMRDTELTWDKVREHISETYFNICWDLINMMRPHLFPEVTDIVKGDYHERIRKTIISWRGTRRVYLPTQRGRTYSKQSEPRNESAGERLDRLISSAAQKRQKRRYPYKR